jgi:hypothetical protein
MIGFIAVITILYIFQFSSNMSYKTFDISNDRPSAAVSVAPALFLSVEGDLDSVMFHDLTNTIRSQGILVVRDPEVQLGDNHFFLRGFRRFEKPFLQRVFSRFKYWYMVVEIEYRSSETLIKSEWFDGTDLTPVMFQNDKADPTEPVRQEGEKTFRQIEQTINSIRP